MRDSRGLDSPPIRDPRQRVSTGRCWVVSLTLALLAIPPVAAEETAAPGWLAKLSFHGYLTQAWADASETPILGIPEDGTTDYRTAALQVRYATTPKDNFVLQLSHERFGDSAVQGIKDDVELDWVFYERRFSDATSLKIGKVQIPLGIYNEIRDVGTLLPFYRPPFNFYGEGAFTSETVDGFVLSHVFRLGRPWAVESHVYYGGWELLLVDPGSNTVLEGRVEDQIGGQLWLETPLPGLRLGAGGSRFTLEDELLTGGRPGGDDLDAWHVSLDGSFDRFLVRAEVQRVTFPPGDYRSYYLQAGVDVFGGWAVYVQGERSDLRFTAAPGVRFDDRFAEDVGVAVNYSWRSDLVAKAEYHWAEGFRVDVPVDVFFGNPRDARYLIVSLSTSF